MVHVWSPVDVDDRMYGVVLLFVPVYLQNDRCCSRDVDVVS